MNPNLERAMREKDFDTILKSEYSDDGHVLLQIWTTQGQLWQLQMHGCHREYPETSGKVRGDREHRVSGRHRKLCHDRIHVSKYSGGTL